jgi:hypothetical protein
MSYYGDPEQRLDPPEMSAAQESLIEYADEIVNKIDKLREKVETFFEELTVYQMEDILGDIEYLKDELESLATDDNILEDEIWSARCAYEDVEGWIKEKEDTIKTEGDK